MDEDLVTIEAKNLRGHLLGSIKRNNPNIMSGCWKIVKIHRYYVYI